MVLPSGGLGEEVMRALPRIEAEGIGLGLVPMATNREVYILERIERRDTMCLRPWMAT